MKSNVNLEVKILKTLTEAKPEIRGYLLPLLKELHFSTAATQGLFRRIIKLNVTGNVIPGWNDLMHDPGVRPDTQRMMKQIKVKPHKTVERIDSTLSTLERLRKVRMLYELGANLEKGLDEEEIDPDAILEQVQKDVSLVGNHAVQTVTTRIGADTNAEDTVKRILTSKGQRRIPTGIEIFDAKNMGFPLGGVVILAANTGGLKTVMLNNIMAHMANQGAKIANVPLEMDAEENIMRDIARVTKQDLSDLLDPLKRIDKSRRKQMYKQYMAYNRDMAKRGGYIDIIEPGFAANIENLLNYVDPLDYDVVGIDYVGLMDGVSGDDQWRALSNAVAYAKRWAGRPGKKRLVIFAAQLTDEDKLKQSKSMADHCTNVWRWRVDDQAREDGIIVVHQDKCRGGAVFDMPLGADFAHAAIRNLTKKELEEWQVASRDKAKSGKGSSWKGGGNKGGPKDKKILEEDDDDDDDDDDNEVVKLKPRKTKKRGYSEY